MDKAICCYESVFLTTLIRKKIKQKNRKIMVEKNLSMNH